MARGRRLGWILPGLPQLLGGRTVEGAAALTLWAGLWGVVVLRFPRVMAAAAGGLDEGLALATLVAGLAGTWAWSWREQRSRNHDTGDGEEGVRPSQQVWRAFRENRLALLGVAVVVAAYLAALLTPFLAPFDPAYQPAFQGGELALRLAPPSGAHLLGTDQFGRDVLSRILYGGRISLSIGFLAVAISVTLGSVLGAVAGYLGGWVDTAIMRFTDMVMAFPRIALLIAIVALFRPSIFLIVAALALTQWPFTTRVVRGEVLGLKEREFAEAARALGFSRSRIIFRHLLPNALAPVIVLATLGIGNTIVLEAGLSFLGMGVQPPTPSWGTMVADGRANLLGAWWIATFPGLAIVLVVLAFNLVGDGIRDALDPRQQGGGTS